MTKTIKITSIVAAILLIVGTLFKISHWPGANVLISIGAATGILLFMLIISAYFGKLAKGYEQFTGIFASLVLIVSLLAFMFKMMHWPGAAILIWIADVGILFAGAFFLVDGAREKEAARSVLKIIAGFFILLLSLVIILAG